MSYVCAYSSVQLDKRRVEKDFTALRCWWPLSSQQYCSWTTCLRGLGRIIANDCKERHATIGATRTLLNCFVVAAAAVDSTPVSMITTVRQHQHQLTSSLTLVTTTLPHSTQKQISSFSSSSLSLSYFGQASSYSVSRHHAVD